MWDCAIIGGGPAGLTAATYLGRFKREAILIDAGESRLKRVPLTRNAPGFPDGIAGAALLARMQDQAMRYGVLSRAGWVEDVRRNANGFCVRVGREEIEARTVLLATGAKLVEPDLPNLDTAMARGLVRYCPICDGYEVQGQNVAVWGVRRGAIAEACFLRTFSDRVTYLWQGEGAPQDGEREGAERLGVRVAAAPLESLSIEEDDVATVSGDRAERFDVVYPCLGCGPQSAIALKLGADVAEDGGVRVGPHQESSVTDLYAAGDVLQGLDQIASACGQAAVAAVAIHNRLRA